MLFLVLLSEEPEFNELRHALREDRQVYLDSIAQSGRLLAEGAFADGGNLMLIEAGSPGDAIALLQGDPTSCSRYRTGSRSDRSSSTSWLRASRSRMEDRAIRDLRRISNRGRPRIPRRRSAEDMHLDTPICRTIRSSACGTCCSIRTFSSEPARHREARDDGPRHVRGGDEPRRGGSEGQVQRDDGDQRQAASVQLSPGG